MENTTWQSESKIQGIQWKVLEGWRFFLTFILLCDHLEPYIFSPEQDAFYQVRKLTPLTSVICFLVLSGFSIAHSIHQRPKGFYQRRFWRIYPLYAIAVLFSLVPFLLLGEKIPLLNNKILVPPDAATVAGYLVFLQGIFVGPEPANRPLWVFSILIFCYLITPIITKLNYKQLLALTGISCAAYILIPYFYMKAHGEHFPYYSYLRYGLTFLLLSWCWFIGFLLFIKRHETVPQLIAIVIGFLALLLNHELTGLWTEIIYLFTCFIIIGLPYIQLPGSLLNILDYLGKISYPVFLFHVPIYTLTYVFLGIHQSVSLIFSALLVSMLIHYVSLRFRDAVQVS